MKLEFVDLEKLGPFSNRYVHILRQSGLQSHETFCVATMMMYSICGFCRENTRSNFEHMIDQLHQAVHGGGPEGPTRGKPVSQ